MTIAAAAALTTAGTIGEVSMMQHGRALVRRSGGRSAFGVLSCLVPTQPHGAGSGGRESAASASAEIQVIRIDHPIPR